MPRIDYLKLKTKNVLIGDSNVFGIKIDVIDKDEMGIYGHLCFIYSNRSIGDFEEVCNLKTSRNFMRTFLDNKSNRIYYNSENMTTFGLFSEIYEVFQTRYWLKSNFESISMYRDIYWIDEIGEYSFRDKLGIIAIDEPNSCRQRIIWKEFKTSLLQECFIPEDYLDQIFKEFVQYIDDIS